VTALCLYRVAWIGDHSGEDGIDHVAIAVHVHVRVYEHDNV